MTKPRIVLPTPFFPPAYKAGGVAKSVYNLVAVLSDEFEIHVHCHDADIDGVKLDPSTRIAGVGGSIIHYHGPGELGWSSIKNWLDGGDILYLNGFFDPVFSQKVAAVRMLTRRSALPLLLAPRGNLIPSALAQKRLKKRAGTAAIGIAGFYRDADWQATSPQERESIKATSLGLGQKSPRIFLVPDIARADVVEEDPQERNTIHIAFFSRIVPIKNLDFALRVLARVETPLVFDIFGPIEDTDYWRECEALTSKLAGRHRITYRGELLPHEVAATLSAYDLYFLPTRSENFGHTIQEAMAAGLPVLISDQTPWRGLEAAGAGWDLALDEDSFVEALERFCALPHEERRLMRAAARRVSDRFGAEQAAIDHRAMFRALLDRRGNGSA